MNEEATFTKALYDTPHDSVTRGVYADWLAEEGRDREAALQRVLAEPAEDAHRLAFARACEAEAARLDAGAGAIMGDGRLVTMEGGKAAMPGAVLRARAEFIRVQLELAKLMRHSPAYNHWRKQAESQGAPSLEAILPHVTMTGGSAEMQGTLSASLRHWAGLERRERDLLASNELRDALTPAGLKYLYHQSAIPRSIRFRWASSARGLELLEPTLSRGFVASVECRAAGWFAAASSVLDLHPVERVTLSDFPQTAASMAPGVPAVLEIRIEGRGPRVAISEWSVLEARGDAGRWELLLRDALLRLLAAEWPQVTFELPAREPDPDARLPLAEFFASLGLAAITGL